MDNKGERRFVIVKLALLGTVGLFAGMQLAMVCIVGYGLGFALLRFYNRRPLDNSPSLLMTG